MLEPKVLIVGGSPSRNRQLQKSLDGSGYVVATAVTAGEALAIVSSSPPTLVIVDEMIPDREPLELSWQIRNCLVGKSIPVFLMSLYCDAETDCHQDTCGTQRLAQRVAKFLDRLAQSPELAEDQVSCNGLQLDRRRHLATIDGRRLYLTATEFRILWKLVAPPGLPRSRAELAGNSGQSETSAQQRTIDAHVKSIRRKLGPRADLIETVRGVGYRFQEAEGAGREGELARSPLS